jgi:hypothetical protein
MCEAILLVLSAGDDRVHLEPQRDPALQRDNKRAPQGAASAGPRPARGHVALREIDPCLLLAPYIQRRPGADAIPRGPHSWLLSPKADYVPGVDDSRCRSATSPTTSAAICQSLPWTA